MLDVAGGKGDLSWLLTQVDGFDSVIVDPRLSKSDHIIRSVTYLRNHPEAVQERSVPGLLTYQPLASILDQIPHDPTTLTRKPRHMRILVDDKLVMAVRHYQETQCIPSWMEFWNDARKRAQEAKQLSWQVDMDEDPQAAVEIDKQQERENHILDAKVALLDVLLNLRLIVGFHPDQATEALVDLALTLKVPLAVVPCCVFPSEFPNRINDVDGTRVRTYSEFLMYLKRKVPKVRESSLDFFFTETAKNRVLFTLPGDI